jgi:hypothetical protein
MLAFTTATTASGSSHEESEAAKMEAANLLVSLSGSRSSTPSVGGGTAGGGAAIAFSPPSGYSLLQSPAASSGGGGGTVSSPRSLPGSRHNLFMPIVNPGNPAAGMLDLRWRSPVSGGGPALSSTASPVPPRFVAKLSHHQQGVIRPELVRPAGAAVTTTAGGGNNNNQLQFLPTTTTTAAEQLSLNTVAQQLQLHQLQQQQHELRGDENAKIFVSIMQPVAGMMTPTSSLSARGSPGGGLRHPHHQQMVSISPLGAAAPPPAVTIPITTFFSSGGGLTTSSHVMNSSAGHAQQTITVIPVSNAAAMMPLRGQPPLNLSGDMMVSIGLKRKCLFIFKKYDFCQDIGTLTFFVGNRENMFL